MNWSVFFTRTGSAIVYAALMILGLMWSHPMAILILAILIQVLCIREFFALSRLVFPSAAISRYFYWIACSVSVYLVVPFVLMEMILFLPILIFPLVLFLIAGLSKGKLLGACLTALVAVFYIGMPAAMLVDLRQGLGGKFALGVLILIWTNDTMAYIVGSFIGKTKFTDISPKKTIEGTVGGMIFTMIIAWVAAYFFMGDGQELHWLVIAAIVALAGTVGDLLESQIKRNAGVKDSGNIMPGHGGALDRFDSLLVVIPFVYLYAYLFMV